MTISDYNDKFLTAEKAINVIQENLPPHYTLPGDEYTFKAEYTSAYEYRVQIDTKLGGSHTHRNNTVVEDTPENRAGIRKGFLSRLWSYSCSAYTPTFDEYAELRNNGKLPFEFTPDNVADFRIRTFLDLVNDWFDGVNKIEKIDLLSGLSLRITWNNLSTKNRDIVTTFKVEDIINDTNGKLLMRQIVRLIAEGYSPFVRITSADLVSGSITSQKITEPLLGTLNATQLDVKNADGTTALKVDSDGTVKRDTIAERASIANLDLTKLNLTPVTTGTITAKDPKITQIHEDSITAYSIPVEAIKNPIPNSVNLLKVEPTNPETHRVEFIDGHPTVVPIPEADPETTTLPELEEYVDEAFAEVWDSVNVLDTDLQGQQDQITDLEASNRSLTSTQFKLQGSLYKALRDIEELKAGPEEKQEPEPEAPSLPAPINIVVNALKELDTEQIAKMASDTLKSYLKGRP